MDGLKAQIVFASNNEGKLKEVRALLRDHFDVLSLSDIGCTEELSESRNTLEGNAIQKAEYVFSRYGKNCFADDTGLEVEALDGRPGVFSARYAGPDCRSEDNIQKLLRELKGKTNRSARFRTVIASVMNGRRTIVEGSISGEIISEKRGSSGFGYDPVFVPEHSEKTFAEMSRDEKNSVSHRKRALENFVASLED